MDNPQKLVDFIHKVFDGSSHEVILSPIKHFYVTISNGTEIFLIQKSLCNVEQTQYFQSISIRHITLAASKLDDVEKKASRFGGRVLECNYDNICVIECPEGILFFITTVERSVHKSWFYDYIISALPTRTSDSSVERFSLRALDIPAGPPIPTLEAAILSNNGKSHVVFPPNSRQPIPFETETFKGVAMLVVRTNPIDPMFKEFFEGRR